MLTGHFHPCLMPIRVNLAVTSFGKLENWIANVPDQLTRLNNRHSSGSEFQFGYLNQSAYYNTYNLDQPWASERIKIICFTLLFVRSKHTPRCTILLIHLVLIQRNLDLRKPDLRKNLDLRKIVGTTDFLVHKLFDLRKNF